MTTDFFTTADGIRLAYRDEKSGLPVLALAGLTRDQHDFDYVAHHLPDVRLIRLDCRGRGASGWSGAATYTLAQETADVIALLDFLGIERVAVIGSSRGGLIGMTMATTCKPRLSGLCLNDVGPALERPGLLRIGEYVGVEPAVATLEEIADRMPFAAKGFAHVPESRWAEEAIRHFVQEDGRLRLPYDPELKRAFDAAMSAPPQDAWPAFDACKGVPLALIRGANSDILSSSTAAEMRRRRPDMVFAEVADRGHVPFLDEPESLNAICAWLELVKERESEVAGAAEIQGGS